MKYIVSFDLDYEDITVEITLPSSIECDCEEEANQKACDMVNHFVLFPRCMILWDTNDNSYSWIDSEKEYFIVTQKKYLIITQMKAECKKRLGNPLSPDDVKKLQSEGKLQSTIFSESYMINPVDDYEVVNWTLRELYQYLLSKWKPNIRFASQMGFSFECPSYMVKQAT